MGLRSVTRVGIACALVTLGACSAGSGLPDREPEVRGTVSTDIGGAKVLTEASDTYFEGMALDRGGFRVVETDGDREDTVDLRDGDEVEVWVGDRCAESYPVQCEIEAIRLID